MTDYIIPEVTLAEADAITRDIFGDYAATEDLIDHAAVSFDPPHLVRAGRRSWLAARYGRFKWSEVQVPLRDVLALTPERPLFGHPTGKSTHWVAFIAPEAPGRTCPPVRWHTDPRTCPHANEHACPTCDHDGYYANTYPDCPWKEQQP